MSVHNAVGACTTALHESLNALHPLSQRSPTSTLHPLLPGLAESFSQLLAQLRHNVTALALSFKPPITAGAAVAQLDKVQQGFGRVAACVVAASGEHIDTESVLVEEWRDGVEKIGSELVRLLKVLETATVEPTNGSSSDAKETPYLLHTAIVWDAVDRLIEDLSTTEIQAVGNRWKAQSEVTKDAWSEFKEYLTEQDEEDEGSGEGGLDLGVENDDDDLGELAEMLSGGKKLSPEERARAEATNQYLGLHQILHATISRYLPLLALEPDHSYKLLLDTGDQVVAAFDSAISVMYPPQEPDEARKALQDLNDRSEKLVEIVRTRVGKSVSAKDKVEACLIFLTKWEKKVKAESATISERDISLASLSHALPE